MEESTALTPVAVTTPIGIDHSILAKLESYEDYLSFYIQLEEADAAFSWLRADTLLQMTQKLGGTSLLQLSKDLRQKHSTVINYVRVAKAFPVDKRESLASFSAHFQASFADSFNDKSQEFNGEKRFTWIKKVAEEGMSVRELAHEIKQEKTKELAQTDEEAAWKFDAMNKAGELIKLIEGLLYYSKNGDKTAYDKLVGIYNKVYDSQN